MSHDTAAWHFRFSVCRIILYKRDKYILLYPRLFFNNILSIVASYLLPLAFILSFLATQKADQRKNTSCIQILFILFIFFYVVCFFVLHKTFVHIFVWRPLVLEPSTIATPQNDKTRIRCLHENHVPGNGDTDRGGNGKDFGQN